MVGGRHYSSSSMNPITRITRSPFLLVIVSLTCFFLLFYIFTTSPSSPTKPNFLRTSYTNQPHLNPNVHYSFVDSLEIFLKKWSISRSRHLPEDTVSDPETEEQQQVRKLDDLIWKTETARLYDDEQSSFFSPPVRVYVYEMPAKFTYDMLQLFQSTYKETFNLTSNGSPVHRLIEQVGSLFSQKMQSYYPYQPVLS